MYNIYLRFFLLTFLFLGLISISKRSHAQCAGVATMVENFDAQTACGVNCGDPCAITGLWTNSGLDAFDWAVNSGGTATANTGPSDDVTVGGNYIYCEANTVNCQAANGALLNSSCVNVVSATGTCHMSFYYHLFGTDIGAVSLDITTDDGTTWTNLWALSGNQANAWTQVTLDLSAYNGMTAMFRFTNTGATGDLADVALDHIEFFGSTMAATYTYYLDTDGDGFGNPLFPLTSCTALPFVGYVANSSDCDDAAGGVNPNATEVTCNGVDENCNGPADDVVTLTNPTVDPDFCVSSGATPTVNAVAAGTGTTVNWYNAAAGGNNLGVGTSYTTPAITTPTTFWAQEITQATTGGGTLGGLLITEAAQNLPTPVDNDMLEIQNFSSTTQNYTGWVVAVSDDYGNINTFNSSLWNLGTMTAGQVEYRTDLTSDNYWGSNIFWNPGDGGWIMIIDNNGVVRDALFWIWTAADIAGFSATINGHSITGANIPWTGNGVASTNCTSTSALLRQGGTDNDVAADWSCLTFNKGQTNPGLNTPSPACLSGRVPIQIGIDNDQLYHSVECGLASGDGVECAVCTPVTSIGNYVGNTICSDATVGIPSPGGSCSTLDFNANPIFLGVQPNANGSLILNIFNSGNPTAITDIQATLVGPVTCPFNIGDITSAAMIACGSNSFFVSMTAANVTPGTYLLIIDTDNKGEVVINVSGTAFPIELEEFQVSTVEQTAVLDWTTATEKNNDYFEIERSQNGEDFTAIGQVQGAGTSQSAVSYQFTDEAPHLGVNYYRLRQVDFNGTASYSEVEIAYFDATEGSISVFPNPFSDELSVTVFSEKAGTVKLQAFDPLGRVIYQKQYESEIGENNWQIKLPEHLADGPYILRFNLEGRQESFKLMRSR